MIKFMLITNDPELSHQAETWGVARIFVDLERLGKSERQGHLDTFISAHKIEDVARVKSSINRAELLVRLNPLYAGSAGEIDATIESGADLLMLPMFSKADELRRFAELVDGRKPIIPLVETVGATREMKEIVKIPGLEEIYIGLNDLHLDMKLNFMFEPLVNGMVDKLAAIVKSANLPFGFGGIARVGEGVIPGEVILAEHVRLGSSSVILSRTFHRDFGDAPVATRAVEFKCELAKLMTLYEELGCRSETKVLADQQRLKRLVEEFVAGRND